MQTINKFPTAKEIIERERETNPNFPFAQDMRFCRIHSANSSIPEVIGCTNCFAIEQYKAGRFVVANVLDLSRKQDRTARAYFNFHASVPVHMSEQERLQIVREFGYHLSGETYAFVHSQAVTNVR